MTRFVGLDVSQKLTAVCVVDEGHARGRGVGAVDKSPAEATTEGLA